MSDARPITDVTEFVCGQCWASFGSEGADTGSEVTCPHCGHAIGITLDATNGSQNFYDDCPACCNAIHLSMMVNEQLDEIELSIDADDEQIF